MRQCQPPPNTRAVYKLGERVSSLVIFNRRFVGTDHLNATQGCLKGRRRQATRDRELRGRETLVPTSHRLRALGPLGLRFLNCKAGQQWAPQRMSVAVRGLTQVDHPECWCARGITLFPVRPAPLPRCSQPSGVPFPVTEWA